MGTLMLWWGVLLAVLAIGGWAALRGRSSGRSARAASSVASSGAPQAGPASRDSGCRRSSTIRLAAGGGGWPVRASQATAASA